MQLKLETPPEIEYLDCNIIADIIYTGKVFKPIGNMQKCSDATFLQQSMMKAVLLALFMNAKILLLSYCFAQCNGIRIYGGYRILRLWIPDSKGN